MKPGETSWPRAEMRASTGPAYAPPAWTIVSPSNTTWPPSWTSWVLPLHATTQPCSISVFIAPSCLLEVDALDHRQALEISPQAVHAELGSPEPHPFAAAEDAAAARLHAFRAGDGEIDGAAAQALGRGGDLLGAGGRDLPGHGAVQAHRGAHLGDVAGDDAAGDDLLGADLRREAGGDEAAGEGFDQGQGGPARAERLQDHALHGLVVLGKDEVAEALADLPLHRLELAPHVGHVGAAHGELGLELRVVGTEAQLEAPVGDQRLHAGEQAVHVGLAEPVGVEALEADRGLLAAPREQTGDDLLLEHATQLARHAGREEEARLADVEREAARGADGVVEDLRGGGEHGLLAVV